MADHRLQVRFADGTAGEVDVRPLIDAPEPGMFEALRDMALFEQVFIDDGAVTWPGGIDLAPDAMYDDIKLTGRRIAGKA